MTVIALPTHGRWTWDVRGGGRAVRVSTHAAAGLLNLSIWRDDVCVGTVRLAPDEAASLVHGLTEGLAEIATTASAPEAPPAEQRLSALEQRLASLEERRRPTGVRRAAGAVAWWAQRTPRRRS